MLARAVLLLLSAGLVNLSPAIGAVSEPGSPESTLPAAAEPVIRSRLADKLERAEDRGLDRDWHTALLLEHEAFALEDDDDDADLARVAFERAADSFRTICERFPGEGEPWWRASRMYWLAAEQLPVEDSETRIPLFELAENAAARGIEEDSRCSGCMLWKFTALGRLATSRGVMNTLRGTQHMAELLEQGIALGPTHADNESNSTLGNLHYGSAIFYRVLPTWFWLEWVLGTRGDKERALKHARTALALHPLRVDYQVEVGAQLLCLGTAKDDETRRAEGVALLRLARETPPQSRGDAHQLAAAAVMLGEPRKSCGFTGDAWLDLDEEEMAER